MSESCLICGVRLSFRGKFCPSCYGKVKAKERQGRLGKNLDKCFDYHKPYVPIVRKDRVSKWELQRIKRAVWVEWFKGYNKDYLSHCVLLAKRGISGDNIEGIRRMYKEMVGEK